MSEARAVFRNTGALAAAQIIERIANAILLFALARTLGASGLGVYSGALAYFSLIAIGGELGATSFLVREVSRAPGRAGEYLVHLGVMASVACGVVAGVVIALVPLLGFTQDLATAITLVMAAVIPGALNVLQEGVFVAFQKAHIRTLITFIGAVFNVGASMALLATGHGPISVLAVFVLTQYLVTAALFVAINLRVAPIRSRFRLRTARVLLRQMKAFIASSLLGALFSRPEIIILTLVASEAQVGYYAAALKVVDLWYFLPATFAMNLFPLLSRSYHQGRERMQEIQDKAMRFLFTFAFPLSVATLTLAPQLIELVYGDALEPAVPALRILAFNVCLYALFELLWRVLSARDEQGAVLRVQCVTTVTRLGGGFALATPFGATGAAVSAVLNQVLHIALLAVGIRRDGTRIPLSRIAWRPAVAAAAMGLLAWLVVPALGLIPTVACAAVAYVALAFALGAISRDDLALIRRRSALP